MEGCRVYDDSLITDVPCAPQVLWCPNSSPSLLGSISMVKFEEKSEEGPFLDGDESAFHHPEKKRRLRSDQVLFLEKSFEIDNKLEPDRKTLLAKQVGLQPRQVAIWFQNRRARYKTKLLEKDYDSLKSDYDKLKADYDSLYSDNHNLKNEVHLLRQKLLDGKPCSSSGRVSSPDSPYSALLEPADSSGEDDDESFVKKSCFEEEEEEDAGFVKKACFPKLEDECYDDLQPNSGNFGFPVQDQGTWFWQY